MLDAAPISTIHSYCSDLLRRFADCAGLPPEFAVDAGLSQELLFDELWPDFLAEELGAAATRAPLWQRVLGAFGEEEIEEVARVLALAGAAADELAENGYRALDLRETVRRARCAPWPQPASRARRDQGARERQDAGLPRQPAHPAPHVRGEGAEGLRAVDPESVWPCPEFWESKGGSPAGTEKQLGERKAQIEGAADEALKLVNVAPRIERSRARRAPGNASSLRRLVPPTHPPRRRP